MLYEIKGKYYILVGNKYVYVNVLPNGMDDIKLEPNIDEYVERSVNVEARVINIDDNFKKRFIRNSISLDSSESPRYNRNR